MHGDAHNHPAGPSAIEAVIVPRTADIGDGFTVRRALPAAQRRMIGPFVFFDQMGPVVLRAGGGMDVRPHPHIGLATVTYLFEGEILHRDSLATVQTIRPGALNWMTAGRGIVHSERTPAALRRHENRVTGIQAWVALPRAHEECAPGFVHHAADALPLLDDDGCRVRLIVGSVGGARSPVEVLSDMFYADVALARDARFALPSHYHERAIYIVEGRVGIAGSDAPFDCARLIAVAPRREIVLHAVDGPARVMVFGGEPMDGPRHVWWNFVASSTERIEQAREDWKAGCFPVVPGEHEWIPAPELKPAAAQRRGTASRSCGRPSLSASIARLWHGLRHYALICNGSFHARTLFGCKVTIESLTPFAAAHQRVRRGTQARNPLRGESDVDPDPVRAACRRGAQPRNA
jgi:redox-sensitive bicupin YhaK (pirin superfamily)